METIINETLREKRKINIATINWKNFKYPHLHAISISEREKRDRRKAEKCLRKYRLKYYQLDKSCKPHRYKKLNKPQSEDRHMKKSSQGR